MKSSISLILKADLLMVKGISIANRNALHITLNAITSAFKTPHRTFLRGGDTVSTITLAARIGKHLKPS
jgi:hypothetical protein